MDTLVDTWLSVCVGPEHHSFPDQHGYATPRSLYHRKYPEDRWLQLCSHHILLWSGSEGQTHHWQFPGVSKETAARRAQTGGNKNGKINEEMIQLQFSIYWFTAVCVQLQSI